MNESVAFRHLASQVNQYGRLHTAQEAYKGLGDMQFWILTVYRNRRAAPKA